MRSIPHFSSAAHLTLAVMLATAMCIPLHAYADGSDEGAPGTSEESGNAPDASEGPADSSADQQDSSDDSADQKAQGSASDAGSENAGAPLATELGNAAPNAPLASPAPAAAGALTMQQGDGEAKSYDSFAAAMADVADYDYKNSKEAYVVTLNETVYEGMTIPENKKVTVDLNGKGVSTSDVPLTIESKYASLKDSRGGGRVYCTDSNPAISVSSSGKLTVYGGEISSSYVSAISNAGTLDIKDGSIKSYSTNHPAIDNSNKLTISGGTITGPNVAVMGRDGSKTTIGGATLTATQKAATGAVATTGSGEVVVSGGTITTSGTAVLADGFSKITVESGRVEGEPAIKASGTASVTVKGGDVVSGKGNAMILGDTASAAVSGGTFDCADSYKVVALKQTAKVSLSGGTFLVNSADDIADLTESQNASSAVTYADRYGAVKEGYNIVVKMTDPAAVVISEDGTETAYDTLTKACSNAPAYSTVKLGEDAVLDKYAAEVKAYGVTLDLNGFSIDGSAYTGNNAALTMKPKYGSKPVEGKDSTLRIINSQSGKGGVIKGKVPVKGACGDSTYDAPLFIGDEVVLETTGGGSAQVVLDSSAYLVYSDKAAAYIGNGGYKVEAADGTSRIYGSYSSAASHAAAGSVITLLNDYTGNETIYSGTSVSTLNLGGHTYTYTGKQQVVYINYDNAGINLKNGKVIATEKLDMAGVAMLYDNGTFTMEKVEMSIPGDSWGIGTNGSKVNNTILLKDSTLNVVDGLGIYFPGSGSVTIDNSVINAKHFGVQVCAGDLVITGANTSIVATGTAQPKTDGDGPILDGAAVSVVERDGYEDLGSVSIEGGSFKSDASSKAVKTYAFNSTDRVEGEWPEAGTVVEISGGSFSSPVAEDICADGFAPQANPDGTYGVHEHSFTIAKHDAEGHWTTCDQCGEATEKLPHTFEWVVDKKPSATVDGSKHEQCSACGFAKDPVSIPATGGTVDPEQGGEGSDQGGPSANDQDASSAEQGKKGPGLAKTDDASQGAIGFFALLAFASAAAIPFARRAAMKSAK